MSEAGRFAEIEWRGRAVSLEYAWVGPALTPAGAQRGRVWMIFLHEGLGSVAMWRDFPKQLCETLGIPGLVYSRPGYGRSTPRANDDHWAPDFMHRQAHEVLPSLINALGIDAEANPPWLFGHSDGGSIALLYAAKYQSATAGIVVLAPHILVEELSIASIEKARASYLETDLPRRLARYHDDPDSAFWGWNDIWLHPEFRSWNIKSDLRSLACPILACQGLDDEYGTLEQIRGIKRIQPAAELLELPAAGHSPHRDQPEAVIAATRAFLGRHHLT